MAPLSSERLAAALTYAERQWHVLPLANKGKHPLTAHGKDDASRFSADIMEWWREWPNANIGISCRPSGLVALDVDPRNGGDDSLWELEAELGTLPQTARVLTGGGGLHLLFVHPKVPLRGEITPGVEIKDAGYIVAPPSLHPSGERYEWDEWGGDPLALAELPKVWVQRMADTCAHSPVNAPQAPSDDTLRRVPTPVYVKALAGRHTNKRGFAQCPFHKGGQERTPSLKVYGDGTWACFACPAPAGRRALGGDIFTFAGLLTGLAEFPELKAWIEERVQGG